MQQRDYYKLNEGEKTIRSSDVWSVVFDRGGFVLTNQRVIKVNRTPLGSESTVHTFNLENIDSIITTTKTNPLLIVLALGFLLFLGVESYGPAMALLGSGICMAIFFAKRKKVVRIATGNSTMWLNVSPLDHNKIQELVSQIEQAKQRRLEGLQATKVEEVTSGSVPSDARERLRQLKALLDDGLITNEEYEQKRQQILREL